MSYPISLNLSQKQAPSLKQMQRLIMSPQMQQALHLLQLPLMELSTMLESELEQNPVIEEFDEGEDLELARLEDDNRELREDVNVPVEKELKFDDKDFEILRQLDEEFRDQFNDSLPSYNQRTMDDEKYQSYLESSICTEASLFEHLMQQARHSFSSEEELRMAEVIIGNFDEKGFLNTPLEEIALLNGFPEDKLKKVLDEIQTFDPYGVGASNLQEALLIQLRCQELQDTLAYTILENHYQDLLHNRIPLIQKELGCTVKEIADAIRQDIAKLDLHPGTTCSREPVRAIVPDVTLMQDGDKLTVDVNEEYLPSFRLNRRYMKMLDDETLNMETKDFIREKIMSAKWLLKNIHQRQNTLHRIAEFLAVKQYDFFITPEGKLNPLTMKELADALDVHESTIARAVSNKYINTPRGLLPLRSFFTNAYSTREGDDISSQTVRDVLQEIINKENKHKPLSDAAIASKIQERGIDCARRTVAKYRAELNIGNAHQRKQYDLDSMIKAITPNNQHRLLPEDPQAGNEEW